MKRVVDYLAELGASVEELKHKDYAYYFSRWSSIYCRTVKREKGTSCYRKFHWHAFSYQFDPCVEGAKAMEQYSRQTGKTLIVLGESHGGSGKLALKAKGLLAPDLSGLRDDLYVMPESVDWTMVFTHEHPDFGPYFSCREWCDQESGLA